MIDDEQGWEMKVGAKSIKMTVQELTDAVAIEVMGWERMISIGFGDTFVYSEDGKRKAVDACDYKPYERARERDMIVERMVELKFHYYANHYVGNDPCAIFDKEQEIGPLGIPIDPCSCSNAEWGIAVMIAAYEAITGKRVEVVID